MNNLVYQHELRKVLALDTRTMTSIEIENLGNQTLDFISFVNIRNIQTYIDYL